MIKKQNARRALGLCSGGLDSILSGMVLKKQGVDVQWISFETPFFSSQGAVEASRMTGIPLMVNNITQIYMNMLVNPPCGYGRHMNPCMDCHTLMFRLAGDILKKGGYDFLFSGEVLGQRPMSQTRSSLRYVEKHSGYTGYILRPLSAKRLAETIPEKNGIVNRTLLYDFAGRSRKPQIRLAKKYGITTYPAPAGGCLLTDKGYSARLRDLFQHKDNYTENELHLLKFGRHFRMENNDKIIVGRTKADNEKISYYKNGKEDAMLHLNDFPGPTVLLPGDPQYDTVMLAAGICVGYSKAPNEKPVSIQITTSSGRILKRVYGISPVEIRKFMV